MTLRYDICQYITKTKMSTKKRLLVEGRDDKSHLSNLLDLFGLKNNIKIDTAETISGDCTETKKNNRAKIDKIHSICNNVTAHKNLYFFRDREFFKFKIDKHIIDLMNNHENNGNLSWTLGHSLENYFLEEDLLCEAFRYTCSSEYKTEAIELFREILRELYIEVAAITLAARDLGSSTYPCKLIQWNSFSFINKTINITFNEDANGNPNEMENQFFLLYEKYKPIAQSTEGTICTRICRGHTAIIMLQRAFSACLFEVIRKDDAELARSSANSFNNQREGAISNALSEAWLKGVKVGGCNYPINLIQAIT